MQEKVLSKKFYEGDTVEVARGLLGKYLATFLPEGVTVGKIVETESYLGTADPASHSFKGPTKRNASMFGLPGHAYVYFTYGMHYCFNAVTGREGVGEAVLIRALEPVEGIKLMQKRRGMKDTVQLCNGPAKLTQALGIDRQLNGCNLTQGSIRILQRQEEKPEIVTAPRIGISQAKDLPLRFYIRGSRYISKP